MGPPDARLNGIEATSRIVPARPTIKAHSHQVSKTKVGVSRRCAQAQGGPAEGGEARRHAARIAPSAAARQFSVRDPAR